MATLKRNGIDVPGMTKREAGDRLDVVFARMNDGLCSFKQAKILQRYGLPTIETTFVQASKWLDEISRNGWRLPNALRTAACEG